ncbi:MAG: galactose mutarotase [Candidatus Caldatribacteriota bacterium]
MKIKDELFGITPQGEKVKKFTMENSRGITASVITWGATLVSLRMPDQKGNIGEVTLGFDNLGQYLEHRFYFGATIGRFANRIARGIFQLEGLKYQLACNEKGKHHLHGGNKGFDKVLWQGESYGKEDAAEIKLSYLSPDGEEEYPGNLKVEVSYSLNEDNELKIEYFAQTDKTTIVNLTNHTYWNLAGAGSGTIMQHQLTIKGDQYLPTDEDLIPTGEIRSVYDTPLDFTNPKLIGRDFPQLENGYDHCFVLTPLRNELKLAAKLYDAGSGRTMEILTTKPALQFYSGNFLSEIQGAGGLLFKKHGALCLETEYFPNSPNEPKFPSAVLYPGKTYHHITIHRFSVQ